MIPVKTHYDIRTCFQNHVPFKGTNSSVIRAYLIRLRGRTYQGRTCRARVDLRSFLASVVQLYSSYVKASPFLILSGPFCVSSQGTSIINLCNHKYLKPLNYPVPWRHDPGQFPLHPLSMCQPYDHRLFMRTQAIYPLDLISIIGPQCTKQVLLVLPITSRTPRHTANARVISHPFFIGQISDL